MVSTWAAILATLSGAVIAGGAAYLSARVMARGALKAARESAAAAREAVQAVREQTEAQDRQATERRYDELFKLGIELTDDKISSERRDAGILILTHIAQEEAFSGNQAKLAGKVVAVWHPQVLAEGKAAAAVGESYEYYTPVGADPEVDDDDLLEA